jgi:hypothetical protein
MLIEMWPGRSFDFGTTQRHGELEFSLTPRFIAVKSNRLAACNGFNRLPSHNEQTVKTVKEAAQPDWHRDESRC